MYFPLLEGQRSTGSDEKIYLGHAEPPQGNSNAKAQMAAMYDFGFPVYTEVSGLETKAWHKKRFTWA